jgi:phage baseplate assembly protein W
MAGRIDIAFPFDVDAGGRSATAAYPEHVRDLIEQVLFTSPGERVNRPDFGAGLLDLVFANANDEVLATARFLVRGSLQRWLGQIISVDAADVSLDDSSVLVTVRYTILATQEQRVDRYRV